MDFVTIDGKKAPAVGMVEQANLRIQDSQVPIDIYIVNSSKESILIGSNWMKKYQANLMLNDKKVTYTAHGRKFEVKIVETTASSSTPYVGYLEMEVSIPPRNTPPSLY